MRNGLGRGQICVASLGRRVASKQALASPIPSSSTRHTMLSQGWRICGRMLIFELSVCREYYFVHDPSVVDSHEFVEERFCKVDETQKKVAWLLTINGLLGFCCGKIYHFYITSTQLTVPIVDFIATLPLSFMSNIFGPTPIILLNFGGQLTNWAFFIYVCKSSFFQTGSHANSITGYFYKTFNSKMVLLSALFTAMGEPPI
jgi:hypothetical protein